MLKNMLLTMCVHMRFHVCVLVERIFKPMPLPLHVQILSAKLRGLRRVIVKGAIGSTVGWLMILPPHVQHLGNKSFTPLGKFCEAYSINA